MIGNIDSQINDRMQMYSGNPQALQQRYAQTQELVDLLALQKMKNDRAAATNAVQGAMQTDTSTYKGRLEQEAMQGARSDVLRSMAPGFQQQGQRMAQMQNRAAMGLPTQAAPNMNRMANGGIVGYAGPDGSKVEATAPQMPVAGQTQNPSPGYLDPAVATFLRELEKLNKQLEGAFPQEKDLFEQKITDLLNTTSPRVKRIASDSQFGLPKKDGMADGGIVGYQEGGGPIGTNNPLNLRDYNQNWEGETGATDGFVDFEDEYSGVRAADKLLSNYGTREGIDTLRGAIARFAPPNENLTEDYISFVSERTGIPSEQPIDLSDEGTRRNILSAMAKMESGKDINVANVLANDESRFEVTTDSGLTPDEAIAMDMQGPEAQQPKFGDELGAQIESGASWLVDYVAENPVEAASYGLMFVPGLNIVRGGIAAMRAAPAIVNAATKVGRAAQKLYTKPRMSGYGSMVQGPKGKFMSAKDAQAAGLRLNRQFSPMRAAGVAGLGLNLGSQLMGGEEGETELPQNEGITAGMYDVRNGMPTDRQKLGSMVDEPSAVLRDNMAERGEEGGSNIDFRALREFLTAGGGQTSTAGALGAGARGLSAYQTAEQGRQDKINQAALELQLKRDLATNEAKMLTQKLIADYEGKITTAEIKVAQEALERLDSPLNETYQRQVEAIREKYEREPIEMENALNRLREAHVQRAVSNVRRGVGLGGAPTTSAAITDMGLE